MQGRSWGEAGAACVGSGSMPTLTLTLALLMLATPSGLHAQVGDAWGSEVGTAAPPATVAAIALSLRSRAIQDSRCYLMNGGAVESFFISEDSPVGSVIGTLSVNGDPGEERGDITLRVQEKGAAVGIAPGSKNLTLLRALDREERAGPSNVYVNVRCDRRDTTDPSFIIPVSVRVWDVNDNAPAWVGAPYRVRLSELTAAGARVPATLRAVDADQPGPHASLHYSVLPGPHSEHFKFPNELESTLVIAEPLDYERVRSLTVTLRAQDQGSPPLHNDTQLYVEVLDADDQNPRFTHEHYSAVLPEDATQGTILSTSPGPIAAADQDLGINAPLHYSATGDHRALLLVDRDSGRVAVTAALLAAVLPLTVVLKAVQVDNADRYALATLTISPGSESGHAAPVRFSSEHYTAAVSEAAAPGAVLATLHTTPAANGHRPPLQFYVSDRSFLQQFAINGAGELVLRRTLDYEARDHYHYQVMVTDGQANDTATLNITVLNVNEWEPRFRYPQYEFRVEPETGEGAGEGAGGGAGLLHVGRLDVFDGDKADTVTLTLRGGDASMFYMNPSGEMFLRQEVLPALNSSVLHVVATAQDSGSPPRQTSVPVLVHVSPALLPHISAAGSTPLLALGGSALALLTLLLCVVLIYVQRRRSKASPSPAGKPYLSHEKPVAPSPPSPAPPAALPALGSAASLQSVSAGASTILANSNSSLDLRDSLPGHGLQNGASGRQSSRVRNKAPPAPAPAAGASPPAALMSDHLCGGAAGRSGVAWPSATIPARVKKLSWDDAAADGKDSGAGAAEASNPALHDHMNLTVYF